MNDKNDFKKITNKKTIKSLLEKCRTDQFHVVHWNIVSGKKYSLNYKISIIRTDKRELILNQDFEEYNSMIERSVVMNNFYIAELGLFFQAEILNEKDNHLCLNLPNTVVQVERRKDIRLKITEKNPIECIFRKKFNNNIVRTFEKGCYDLSAGGLSVIISKAERDLFKVGDIINEMEIYINHVKIRFEAEIVNFIAIEPDSENGLIYSGYKLCLKFFQIGEDEKSMIENYIFYTIEENLKGNKKVS
jgi:c-di-GMP-binding flagellar brake protein YcgR